MKYILFILSLFFCTGAVGQDRFISSVQKKQYKWVEKNMIPLLDNDSSSITLPYAAILYFMDNENPQYSVSEAYKFLQRAEKRFQQCTDKKILQYCAELSINNLQFNLLHDSICLVAFTEAMKSQNIQQMEFYLSYFNTAPFEFRQKIQENLHLISFQNLQGNEDLDALNQFITLYPNAKQKNMVILKRDSIAFSKALAANSLKAFDHFLNNYPFSNQFQQALEFRNQLAFVQAQQSNTVEAFNDFITKYPQAKQVELAKQKINNLISKGLAQMNSSLEIKLFLEKNPKSPLKDQALQRMYLLEYQENTQNNHIESYLYFIENYPQNPRIDQALDSLWSMASRQDQIQLMVYVLQKMKAEKKAKFLPYLHKIYTSDGEYFTIEKFYKQFDDLSFDSIKRSDFQLASEGRFLMTEFTYNPNDSLTYDSFIKKAAPRYEKSFLALQKMISPDIKTKDFNAALSKIQAYAPYFRDHPKWNNLVEILSDSLENLSLIPLNEVINSSKYAEQFPLFSADGRQLYFSQGSLDEELGDQDIYMTEWNQNKWTKPQLQKNISSENSTERPLSISADGQTLLLYKDGELFFSTGKENQWTAPIPLTQINKTGDWQGEASMTYDKKAIVFSSIRKENMDLHARDRPENYHGEDLPASDLYVACKDSLGQYSIIQSLGTQINTRFTELNPIIAPDMMTLFFASSGHGGLGGLDIFMSKRLSDSCWNCWSPPLNLGKEINTEKHEQGFTITQSSIILPKKLSYMGKEQTDFYKISLPKKWGPYQIQYHNFRVLNAKNENIPCSIQTYISGRENIDSFYFSSKDGFKSLYLNRTQSSLHFISQDGYLPLCLPLPTSNHTQSDWDSLVLFPLDFDLSKKKELQFTYIRSKQSTLDHWQSIQKKCLEKWGSIQKKQILCIIPEQLSTEKREEIQKELNQIFQQSINFTFESSSKLQQHIFAQDQTETIEMIFSAFK